MSFQKLTPDSLQKVRSLLEKQYPKSAQILNLINLQLKGTYLKDTFQTTVYGIPDTDIVNFTWTPSKTVEKTNPTTNLIYIPPAPSLSLDLIGKSYQQLIDWKKPQVFQSVPQHFVPELEIIGTDLGGHFSHKFYSYSRYMPKDDIGTKLTTSSFQKRAGDNLEIASLTEENTMKMCAHWKFASADTQRVLKEKIRVFGCARGIFRKGGRGNEDLVSWAQLLKFGNVGSLYTVNDFRGKGLGEWTLVDCLKLMADKHGLTPAVENETTNVVSNKTMDKIGLKIFANVVRLHYVPPKMYAK